MRRVALFGTVMVMLAAGVTLAQAASAIAALPAAAPTVVLVHGACERASSWDAVAARLRDRGYRVVVPGIALRTLAGDATTVAGILQGINGPTVVVGHSYGGSVISNAAEGIPGVEALVYVAAFAPDRGESSLALGSRVPGSLLPVSIIPVPFVQAGGGIGLDVYVSPLMYRTTLAHDVPAPTATAMAATQRPITLAALTERSAASAWNAIPSWYLVASSDRAIPSTTQRFMAERAQATTVEIDSSHSVQVSHPDAVANLILTAARSAVLATSPRPYGG